MVPQTRRRGPRHLGTLVKTGRGRARGSSSKVSNLPKSGTHVDPSQLLPYFQILGQIALVVGALFAGYQLWLLRQGRQEQADLQTLTAFNSVEFRTAFARVNALPLHATAADVRDRGVEDEATTVMMTFEMLGVLVHSRRLSLKMVEQ